MATFKVQYLATASTVVTVEAEDADEARERADEELGMGPSLCAQCAGVGTQSDGIDLGDWYPDDLKHGVWGGMMDGVCGETYDHELREIASRDGWNTYVCRVCGAEIVEEPEE